MLVSQERMLVELHRRAGDGWEADILTGPDDSCARHAVGLTLSLAEIYRNVNFDEAYVLQGVWKLARD